MSDIIKSKHIRNQVSKLYFVFKMFINNGISSPTRQPVINTKRYKINWKEYTLSNSKNTTELKPPKPNQDFNFNKSVEHVLC
jgi:hypothetical protein